MRWVVLFVFCVFICLSDVLAQVINAGEAVKHIGEIVTVQGEVFNFELTNRGKTTVLYLTKDFPHEDMTIFIEDNSTIINHPEFIINGNKVSVKGVVTTFRNKPAIKVKEWKDVKIETPIKVEALSKNIKETDQQNYKPFSKFSNNKFNYLLDNFVFNQAYYKGKELNVLFRQLEIPVIGYIPALYEPASETTVKESECPDITLYFCTEQEKDKILLNKNEPPLLGVSFKTPILRSHNDIPLMLLKKYHMKYNDAVREYYGTQIIDSIWYVHYHFSNPFPPYYN